MPLKRIVKLSTGTISAGSFVDVWYAPEINLKIHNIIAIEASGASLNNVHATLYIGDVPYAFPDVSLAVFSPSNFSNPDIDLTLPAGVKLSMRVTNNSSSAVNVFIYLICTE